jgi:ATP-dependent helicase Lhr and Lhr-like helicase
MTAELRRILTRSWHAFFSPFGGKLLPVQEAAIPGVLSGRDLLVSSPTAGGKTEAVVAPLAERALAEEWSAPSIVYVCPTRPLVNDLYRRISLPLTNLGVSCDRRTGDHPRPVHRRPPTLLVTTPESLD